MNRRTWLVCAILFAGTLCLFSRSARNEFVAYDDPLWVTRNPHVEQGLTAESLVWALTTTEIGYWHPVTWLSHLLDVEMLGMNAARQHMMSAAIHSLNVALLFVLLLRLTGAFWPSAFAAAVFGVHPLRVESVAWIAERKDVLYVFFGLLTLLAYEAYARAPSRGRSILVAALYVLSLASKPMLVTMPFLLLLLDIWPLRRIELFPLRVPRKVIVEKLPLIALAALFCAITYWAQERAQTMYDAQGLAISSRVASAAVGVVEYLKQFVWPTRLAVLYPLQRTIPFWKSLTAGAIVLGISVASIFALRRRPYLFVGWFWFLGTLVPVAGIIQVGLQATADRYTYFPQIGLAICLAWGVADLTRSWRARAAILWPAASSVIIALASLTWMQIGYWRDTMSLFERALAVTSDNYIAHSYVGSELARRKEYPAAEAQFREAIRIRPDFARGHYNLANCLSDAGDIDGAIHEYEQAVEYRPNFAEAYLNIGRLRAGMGQMNIAAASFAKAAVARPDFVEAHENFAQALLDLGDVDGAVKEFKAALKLRPDSATIRQKLDRAIAQQQALRKNQPGR